MNKYSTLDSQTYSRFVTGRKSERLVEAYLRANNFSGVRVLGGKGRPDLTFDDSGIERKVEVKTATRLGNSWYVSKIGKNRKKDDFVAIVIPNNSVILEPMSQHVLSCSASGRRTVTDLVIKHSPNILSPRKKYVLSKKGLENKLAGISKRASRRFYA